MSRLLLLLLMGGGQRFLYIGCDDIPSLLRVASAVLISMVLCVTGIITTLSDNFATARTTSSTSLFTAVGYVLFLISN